MHYLITLAIIIVVLLIIVYIAYNISVTYQQCVTTTIQFNNTHRYINKKYKLDSIDITVTGSIKGKSMIVPSDHIKDLVKDAIIKQYEEGIIVHEANTFTI